MSQELKILIYGYGNPGRQDDGLGIAFTESLEQFAREMKLKGVTFDSNYQLNIEDAEAAASHDIVVFADASDESLKDFCISVVEADENASFTTHAASPGYVMYLSRKLFGHDPIAYLVHMKGYEWDFREGLSVKATDNLTKALDFFRPFLEQSEKLTDLNFLKHKFCEEIKNK